MVGRPLRKNSLQTGKFSLSKKVWDVLSEFDLYLIFHRIIGGQETPKHAFPWVVRIAGGALSFKAFCHDSLIRLCCWVLCWYFDNR